MAVAAADCDWPTTSGTVTGSGPRDMTKSTDAPGGTLVADTGSWLIMLPSATVSLNAGVTVPTVSPTFVIAVSSAEWDWPTMFGTVDLLC